MTQTPQNPETTVRALIERYLDDDEPPYRQGMADVAIGNGASAARRRGYLLAGTTISVVAVAAGAIVVGGRISGAGDDWSIRPGPASTASPAEYEDPAPSYADKVREIHTELPGLMNPLLPSGMTLRHDPSRGGGVDAAGDLSPEFLLRKGPVEVVLRVSADDQGFTNPSAAPTPVDHGSFRLWTSPIALFDKPGFTEWIEYTPTDTSKPPIRFLSYGSSKTALLDGAAVRNMLNAPGFTAVADLLDLSRPASAAAVRQRYQIEDRIDTETAGVLPPGYRLKLSPALPYGLELVGPDGVNTFDWDFFPPGELVGGRCPVDALCYTDDLDQAAVLPDGMPRLGSYSYTFGKSSGSRAYVTIEGKPRLTTDDALQQGKPDSETAPQGPGLTPQQAMAILRAPALAKVIADVHSAVDVS